MALDIMNTYLQMKRDLNRHMHNDSGGSGDHGGVVVDEGAVRNLRNIVKSWLNEARELTSKINFDPLWISSFGLLTDEFNTELSFVPGSECIQFT